VFAGRWENRQRQIILFLSWVIKLMSIINIYLFYCINTLSYMYKCIYIIYTYIIVPDKRIRILEVVLVRRLVTWVLGIWRGKGLGKGEKGEVSLPAT
jgi:hypothetical protein